MTSQCEHCFRQERGGLVPKISGPMMTRFQYVCRWCGESVYLGYQLDEAGNPVHESPASGHLFTGTAPDAPCDLCRRPG